MRNYFTIDGVDSRDFGVYISGQGTFKAPARDYNLIPVPGRNGDLVGPEKRFLNGTLVYPAFIYSNFDANIKAFRNFLLSLVGYHDLIDSYHPDEIRKVLFQGPFEPEVEAKNDAGRFDLEFICKPQRYLASGQEEITFEAGGGTTETYTGAVVTFDASDGSSISGLTVDIEPVQTGSGDPSPLNVRPITGFSALKAFVSPTQVTQDATVYTIDLNGTRYGGTLDVFTGVLTVTKRYFVADGVNIKTTGGYGASGPKWLPTINLSAADYGVWDTMKTSYLKTKPPTLNVQNDENTADFGSSAHAIVLHIGTMQGTDGTHGYNSAAEVHAAVNAYLQSNPLEVCYTLLTPFTVQLTATQVQTLVGQINNVWADTGNVTVDVLVPIPQTIENPTLFDSQPLMRVYGEGTLGINSQSVTITQADVYTDIDCEMMDCFKGTANKNMYVQFTDHNFPVFKPGVNDLSLGTGITKVEVTPRWWIV